MPQFYKNNTYITLTSVVLCISLSIYLYLFYIWFVCTRIVWKMSPKRIQMPTKL